MVAEMRRQVLIVDPLHASGIDRLSQSYQVVCEMQPEPDRLAQLCSRSHAVVLRSGVALDARVLESASQLEVVVRAGNGLDNIDVGCAKQRGIPVYNIPDASIVSVAEHTFGLMLATARRIALANAQMRNGVWAKADLMGVELHGKTLGIVGIGKIGTQVARIAAGFGMHVLATASRQSEDRARALGDRDIELVSLDELVQRADFVSLHVPLTPGTKGLIGSREFQRMRNTAVLVNLARGGVVDEDALHYALSSGQIAFAASDVFARERTHSPLLELDNFVATPHIGAMTEDVQKQIALRVANYIDKHLV